MYMCIIIESVDSISSYRDGLDMPIYVKKKKPKNSTMHFIFIILG